MSHPRRVFLDFPAEATSIYGLELPLSREDAHHFRTVLRLHEGAALTVIDRTSTKEFDALVTTTEPFVVRIVREKIGLKGRSRVASLTFGLAKGKNTEFVCEKACELGVRTLILWQASHSVVRIDSGQDRLKKLDRWNKILESAGKQSGNDVIPRLVLALNLHELFEAIDGASNPGDRKFICSLSPGAKTPIELMTPPGEVHLVVGPEGDFSEEEEKELLKRQFEPLSLGPLVLRCETAAVVAVSMTNGAWGFLPPKS